MGEIMVDRATGSGSFVPVELLSKLTDHQLYAREFFCQSLLEDIAQSYQPDNIAFFYFNRNGEFLSLRTPNAFVLKSAEDPYTAFSGLDVVRHTIHRDAVHDGLTYFNTVPRLYKSTDIISAYAYDDAPYTRFIEDHFGAHYSATMAFGMNAYIQVAFYKTHEHGDFTGQEMDLLEQLYVYLASSYRTFKKYEQSNIVAEIMSQIIKMGEHAFLIADDYSHILNCNELAENYLTELLGMQANACQDPEAACTWLPFLLNPRGQAVGPEGHTNTIKDCTFTVRTYDRSYSNGIVDRYYWATITKENVPVENPVGMPPRLAYLTRSEQKVALLLDAGLTYQEIAEELVISFHTVKKHVQSIYKKCGVNNRLQFSRWLEQIDEG